MLSHKKYMEIQNLNPEIGDMFEPGDQIIIQEKIDGSNASFQYDRETDSVICFSRNQILSPELHLRGFYEWVQKLDKERVHAVLGDNLRMFGEWLVRLYPIRKTAMKRCTALMCSIWNSTATCRRIR